MSKPPALVEVLLKPETYAHHPQKVELVQTQMSFLFLAGESVYKVKKPVNLGYLDYTTLEKRRFFCQQEIELNRRLCPDTYLEVVPIISRQGQISLGGEGEIIEYAVKMKQLPADRMMDKLLPQNLVTEEMVARVAEKLAAFHDKARTSPEISAYGKPGAIKINTDENFAQAEKYIDISIPSNKYNKIKAYTDNFAKSNKSLFDKRVKDGKIKTATVTSTLPTFVWLMESVSTIALSSMTGSDIVTSARKSPSLPWTWTVSSMPTCLRLSLMPMSVLAGIKSCPNC